MDKKYLQELHLLKLDIQFLTSDQSNSSVERLSENFSAFFNTFELYFQIGDSNCSVDWKGSELKKRKIIFRRLPNGSFQRILFSSPNQL